MSAESNVCDFCLGTILFWEGKVTNDKGTFHRKCTDAGTKQVSEKEEEMRRRARRAALMETLQKNMFTPVNPVVVDERGDWKLIKHSALGDQTAFEVTLLGMYYWSVFVGRDKVLLGKLHDRVPIPSWVMMQLLAEVAKLAADEVQQDLDAHPGPVKEEPIDPLGKYAPIEGQ